MTRVVGFETGHPRPAAPAGRRGLSMAGRRRLAGVAMTTPALAVITLFFFVPLALMLWMSLHDWPLLGEHKFVGLENYRNALQDDEFRTSVVFTVKYTVITTPVLFLLGCAQQFPHVVRSSGKP